MAQYSKSLATAGFEIDLMKRIVNCKTQPVSLQQRLVAGYFVLANMLGDASYFSHSKSPAEERRAIWQAFLGGNLTPMRQYLENREFNEKMVNAFKADIDDPLLGC